MKKNVLKLLLIVVILIFGIILQDRTVDYATIIKISNATKEITTETKNLQVRVTEKYNNGSEKIAETYIKDGVFVTRRIDGKNSPSNSLTWTTTNEEVICNSYYEYEFEYDEGVVKGLNCVYNHGNMSDNQVITRLATGNLLLMYDKDICAPSANMSTNIFNMPKIEDSEYNGKACYALKTEYKTWFVEKDTLRTIAIECKSFEDDSPYFYTFEYDIEAPDGIYDAPNAAYYDKVEFYEMLDISSDEKNVSNEKSKAISGTNLKPGEELIEVVDLKDEEELNFLKLTGNEFGLQGFNINTLETYNKFREKYSGLRELTKEDFKEYYVGIAYKEGYRLNYLQSVPATKNSTMNYIFNTEKSANPSITLIVTPIKNDSLISKFIKNNEKLNISEETAIKIVSDNIDELNKDLVLSNEEYFDIKFSEIVVLDNETFAGLDVIKTPVKGKTPMCWKLTVVDTTSVKLDAFVDIMTGDIIGALNR